MKVNNILSFDIEGLIESSHDSMHIPDKYINQKTLSCVEAANYVSDVIESYAINGYGRYAIRDKTY